jgi:hypothetical protein
MESLRRRIEESTAWSATLVVVLELPPETACTLLDGQLHFFTWTEGEGAAEGAADETVEGGGPAAEKRIELSVSSGDNINAGRFWEADEVGTLGTLTGKFIKGGCTTSKLRAVAVDVIAQATRASSIVEN